MKKETRTKYWEKKKERVEMVNLTSKVVDLEARIVHRRRIRGRNGYER